MKQDIIVDVLLLVSGIVSFSVFAYDIEHDRDSWTWMWLFNSMVIFYLMHLRIIKRMKV
jgi:uncharacterized membrane protein SirB2